MAWPTSANILVLLVAFAKAFPTEPVPSSESSSSKLDGPPTRHTVTYILGQPIKNGSVQSPAELLSPDRYEFYTFDDDGQIVKKLMSVEEIQKIIANSREGPAEESDPASDYYQVLTVTPDIESIPAVRVNANEPLFSIHDVIASVQNVLKNEIKNKLTTPSATLVVDGFQNAHLVTDGEGPPSLPPVSEAELAQLKAEEKISDTLSEEFTDSIEVAPSSTEEPKTTQKLILIVTEKPIQTTEKYIPTSLKTTAVTSQTQQKAKVTTTTIRPFTKKPTAIVKKPQVTNVTKKQPTTATKRPLVPTQGTPTTSDSKLSALVATETPSPPTKVQILKTTSSVSQSSSNIPSVTPSQPTTSTLEPTSSETFSSLRPIVVGELFPGLVESINHTTLEYGERENYTEAPMSLLDAHPAFSSNDSYLNLPNIADSLFSIESLLFDNISLPSNFSGVDSGKNLTSAASVLSEVQIPMNQDLAESVSSVLSQIANEISMNSAIKYEESTESTTPSYFDSELSTTTEDFVSTTSWPLDYLREIIETTTENVEETTLINEVPEPISSIANSFKPQNSPKPFSKQEGTTENPTTTEAELEFTSEFLNNELLESRTNDDLNLELTTEEEGRDTTTFPTETETTPAVTTTEALENNIETASRLEVLGSDNSSSIEIIEEAETGHISRPTMQPEEISTRPGTGASSTTAQTPVSTTGKKTYGTILAEKINFLESSASTISPVLKENLVSKTVQSITTLSATTPNPTSTTTPVTTTTASTNSSIEVEAAEMVEITSSTELNPNDEVEDLQLSFVPMMIRSSSPKPTTASSTPTTTTTTTTTTTKTTLAPSPTELIKKQDLLEQLLSDDILEAKIGEDDISDKSDTIESSHKVILGDISKPTKVVLAVPKDPSSYLGGLKQNYPRPQKPQKPVFIKPTKVKPQYVEPKPSKPIRPSSSEEEQRPYETPLLSSPSALELDQAPAENLGLEATTVHLEADVRDFVELCNELAFTLWSSITHNGLSFVRSVVVSPFAVTSLLAMVFLGARGPTSGQMNDVLKLDDVVTFNPHLVFRNVTESLVVARNPGVATAAFVRELYSERTKGKLLEFYKERAQQFYDGHVEEVNFKAIGETLRRQTNHLVKRHTWGKIKDFLQGSTLIMRPPLAAFSANIFQSDCLRASTKDRDGEMYFVVLPSNRLRRLVPIPAAVWRDDFLAGYEPNLDATVAAVGAPGGIVSTIFVMPGQQGLIAPGDSLARLEHHLLGASYKRGHWDRLMRSLLRRPGLELQVPRLSHKSVVNVTASLQKMGLRDLFSAEKADLTGLNGLANDLHLSDMVQVNMFSTCGDDSSHHTEFYPATPLTRREKSADNVFAESIESLFAVSDFEDPSIAALPLELRPRQARIPTGRTEGRTPEPPRLRLDRPFLFFVRHNPTGLILHIGRFNPRLMH